MPALLCSTQNARFFLIDDKDDVVERDLNGRCLPMRWDEMTYDELRTVLVDDTSPQQWPSTGDTQVIVDGDEGDGSTGEAEQLALVAESISIDFLNMLTTECPERLQSALEMTPMLFEKINNLDFDDWVSEARLILFACAT